MKTPEQHGGLWVKTLEPLVLTGNLYIDGEPLFITIKENLWKKKDSQPDMLLFCDASKFQPKPKAKPKNNIPVVETMKIERSSECAKSTLEIIKELENDFSSCKKSVTKKSKNQM